MCLKRKALVILMAVLMVVTSLPLEVLALPAQEGGQGPGGPGPKEDLPPQEGFNFDNVQAEKHRYLNLRKATPTSLSPKEEEVIASTEGIFDEENLLDGTSGPTIPTIYTLVVEYMANKNNEEVPNYQPYMASVPQHGAMKREIDLPQFGGFYVPGQASKTFRLTADYIRAKAAETGNSNIREADQTVKTSHAMKKK